MADFNNMTSPPHGDEDADPPFLEVWRRRMLIYIHVLTSIF